MIYLGDFPTGATVYVPFHTFDANGASVTLTGLAVTDIEVYKNGSATQRASDAGYALLDTDGIDFDGLTGLHGFSIDLSDDTDSGFYAAGNEYMIAVSAVTVDSQTVSFWAATFSIERAGEASANVANLTEVAEAILLADWEAITGIVPDRSTLNALRFLRNKWTAADDALTVYEEDDTTPAWTAALSSNAAANPVTGSAPVGSVPA